MPIYVNLLKFTEQGIKSIKDVPARFAASKKLVEECGGKVLSNYVTMGDYDIVSIAEGPNDETAAAAVLSIASRGTVTTTTMRAFTEAEFAEILKKVK